VREPAGGGLPCELGTADGRLTVSLVLDAARVASPPEAAAVTLRGAPSVHALRLVDGRALGGTRTVRVPLEPRLEGGRARLVALGGHPAETLARAAPLPPPWRLVYDAPLDPSTLDASPGPVRRTAAGVALGEVPARVVLARLVGARCELDVRVEDAAAAGGGLVLDLARWGARDLTGSRPEPPLVVPLAPPR